MPVGTNDVRLERAPAVPCLRHGVGAIVLSLMLSACGGDDTPGVELCSSMAGLPALLANFRSPSQSSDSEIIGYVHPSFMARSRCSAMAPYGRIRVSSSNVVRPSLSRE